MNILRLLEKELHGLKLHFLIVLAVNFLLMAYFRGKINTPGAFLVFSSIPFTILYVAIFIQGYHVVKKEFDSGTIYLLLQLPVSLEEVLFSKFLAVFIEGFLLAFLTSIITAVFITSYHQVSSFPTIQTLKLAFLSGLVTFPVLTIFYPAFSVKTVARRSSGFLAFLTAIGLLYIDHLIFTILSPLRNITFTFASYHAEGIFINVTVSLQIFVFYAIVGLASLFGGIWAIKKFNSL